MTMQTKYWASNVNLLSTEEFTHSVYLAADVEQHDKEIVQVVKALLKAYNQLLPGIGMMACQDYANINDAPIKAKCLLARLEGE